jgi:hypothetical protein
MCGVPYHAVEATCTRLLRKGYRIAICDQMEDPKLTKKIVRREVTRVLTPGTALDNALGQEQNNFLAAFQTGSAKDRSAPSPCSTFPPATSAPPNSPAPPRASRPSMNRESPGPANCCCPSAARRLPPK